MNEFNLDQIQQHPLVRSLTQISYDQGYDYGVVETLHYIRNLIESILQEGNFIDLVKKDAEQVI